MTKAAVISLVLFSLACSKEETKGSPRPAPDPGSARAGERAAVEVDRELRAMVGKYGYRVSVLGCDKALSADLRDKYFKGATITDATRPDLYSANCNIEAPVTEEMKATTKDATWKGDIQFVCWHDLRSGVFDSMVELTAKIAGATKLDGIGKSAIKLVQGTNGNHVLLWAHDNDSDCEVKTVLPTPIHKDELVKDLIAALPIK